MRNPPQHGWQSRSRPGAVALLLLLASPIARAAWGVPPPQAATKDPPAVVPSASDKQKAMQADMDRLLLLARQLKLEVDKSRKDELAMKVIRDADEIDKLARSARGRIR